MMQPIMKNKIVIGFVGLAGAGKSSALEGIKSIGTIITMGDVIRKEAELRNLPLTSENLGMIAKDLRKEYGNDVIAKKCVELIKEHPSDTIFIDGLRSMNEVNIFREFLKFPIISIIIDEEIRIKRLLESGREDDSIKIDDIKERDEREAEFGLKEVIENSDYKINNNSTITDLQEKTRKIIEKIIMESSNLF